MFTIGLRTSQDQRGTSGIVVHLRSRPEAVRAVQFPRCTILVDKQMMMQELQCLQQISNLVST